MKLALLQNKDIVDYPMIFIYGHDRRIKNKLIMDLIGPIIKSKINKLYIFNEYYDEDDEDDPQKDFYEELSSMVPTVLFTDSAECTHILQNEYVKTKAIVILDHIDLTDDMLELCMNGRHYGLTIFVTYNSFIHASPEFRMNTDYIFCSYEPDKDLLEALWDNFFDYLPYLHQIRKLNKQYGTNNKFLVSSNRIYLGSVDKRLFYCRVKLPVCTKNIDNSKFPDLILPEVKTVITGESYVIEI
jgi:hypothetical protein